MTNREKAICEVYTGICFCAGEQRKHVHEYAEKLMGRPVLTHEFVDLTQTLRDRATEDFIAICKGEPVTTAEQPEPMTREKILDTAKKCVSGDREQDYGTPEQNFQTIANLWIDYLQGKGYVVDIEPEDAAAMLGLFKIARIASGHGKADNWVDLAGYAACGGELEAAVTDD